MAGLLILCFLVGCIMFCAFNIIRRRRWIYLLRTSLESLRRAKESTQQNGLNDANENDLLESLGYEIGSKIGQGTYAEVKKAYSRNIGKDVAIKIVAKEEVNKFRLNKDNVTKVPNSKISARFSTFLSGFTCPSRSMTV